MVYGGGMRLRVWRQIGVRADLKQWRLHDTTIDFFGHGNMAVTGEPFNRASVGVYYRYGGK
jgi:hypothetical protein